MTDEERANEVRDTLASIADKPEYKDCDVIIIVKKNLDIAYTTSLSPTELAMTLDGVIQAEGDKINRQHTGSTRVH